MDDYAIIGGGIVGLATAVALGKRVPSARIIVIEKESALAAHQSGRNSGVIHAGIYYAPGSFKARFSRAGNLSMVAFCQEHGIKHEVCGKLIIATEQDELPRLEKLHQRGLQNELEVRRIGPEEMKELEPNAAGIAAIHVAATGIVNYSQVCAKYAEIIRAQGGQLHLGARVNTIRHTGDGHVIETSQGEFQSRFLINCAGLHSDRVARMSGEEPQARIVPFRGEYYELKPGKRHLVRGLIYPVPNPDFPFLGVHCTRMIDGTVHLGPNAVLAFKREGYRKSDINLRDLADTLFYPGFWKLAAKNASEGMREVVRSSSKAAFTRSLQRLVPAIQADDIVPCKAGVRAQALRPDGALVDDFLIIQSARAVHVCNAPSPGATASLEIGNHVAGVVAGQLQAA